MPFDLRDGKPDKLFPPKGMWHPGGSCKRLGKPCQKHLTCYEKGRPCNWCDLVEEEVVGE